MIEVFNPTGIVSSKGTYARRLDTLDGKKIGLLSNGNWQSERMLTFLQGLLGAAFPTSDSKLIAANSAIQDDKTVDAIIKEGYDAVIVGNAA